MKTIIIFPLLSLMFSGCATESKLSKPKLSPKVTEEKVEIKPTFVSFASEYLKEFRSVCKEESGKLWSTSLCVPMIIVDRESLNSVATNQTPEKNFEEKDGVFVGKYEGPQLYANTSIKWKDQRWSMILWPLPKDKAERTELLLHEAWHSVQSTLNLPMNSNVLSHLDRYDGRLLIRLEWNALLSALEDEKSQQQRHIKNALNFRRLRFKKYPKAKNDEAILDFNEGLAAYTGFKIKVGTRLAQVKDLREKLNGIPKVLSLTRSASYYTGPLYGALLDEMKPNWKSDILDAKTPKDFGDLLEMSVEGKPLLENSPNATLYKFQEINTFELKREKNIVAKISKYKAQVAQPKGLRIEQNPGAMQMFDPRGILIIGEFDYIYTVFETTDSWGTLRVSDGVRVKLVDGKKVLFLSPPTVNNGQNIQGEEWKVELNAGWSTQTKNGATVLVKDK